MANAFSSHLLRVEKENESEKFSLAPAGSMAQIYTKTNTRKDLSTPGWCRIWVMRDAGKIVAHCSLYSLATPREDEARVVFGTINIERAYRGRGLYPVLQAPRLAFCDEHQLTLAGPVALGNDNAFHAHRKAGYLYMRQCVETFAIWLYREPRPPTPSSC